MFVDETDHAEIDAVRADVESENRAEFMDMLQEAATRLIGAAREVPSGSLYEMTDQLGQFVLDQNMNVGEMSRLAGLLALTLGRPTFDDAVVNRLAKRLYDDVHDSRKSPATDDDRYRDYIAGRWAEDTELRDKYRGKAAALLGIAFNV